MPLNIPRLPLFAGLDGYQTSALRSDVSAGLAIAAVGPPSAIAYPAIAGLPPETGLYASIAPLVACALFGPSRKLIVGPDAATMTVLAAVLAAIFATPGVTTDRVTVTQADQVCLDRQPRSALIESLTPPASRPIPNILAAALHSLP
ncbi:MFS superfamily sulfate permease-like transporter [Sinorhizobium fredii]|uniref:Putative sulfate transporter n=1 Tax=Sinorhizobium fredii (strain USDA 257) TaxID=1185652 RepID=I3XAB7_SINF2|nr:putative sulfate transporter [Sinorhizobium fredii USDA 257]